MDYAKAIRVIRAAKGLSQSEVALKLGLTPSSISLLESGKRKPSTGFIERFCDVFSIPPHFFTLLASEKKLNIPASEMDSITQSLLELLMNTSNEQSKTATS